MLKYSDTKSTINVRLERRVDALEKRDDGKKSGDAYIDIWVEIDKMVYPIELKYKTIQCTITDGSEEYKLKQHGASDIGCYLYLKDVKRIEELSESLGDNFGKGFAIMLTNDHLYWDQPKTTPDTTIFRDFRIYNKRTIPAGQNLDWHPSSNNRPAWQKELGKLNDNYFIEWENYSNFNKKEGEANEKERMPPFKYSIIIIN